MSEEAREDSTNYRLPSGTTLQHCAKLGIVEDKPIMFDYWTASCDKDILIGVREGGEKLLVKSEEEYTSPVSKIYKAEKSTLLLQKTYICCFFRYSYQRIDIKINY